MRKDSPSSSQDKMTGKGYSREFQAMLDSLEEEDYAEESSQFSEKKRRLSNDQVKALEKNFAVENKLEPDRKLMLAEQLGLQPRQVAIWFQNRRARWKTKQLERDFNSLKASYDALKVDYDKSQKENETLLRNLKEMKRKHGDDNGDSSKEEVTASESDNNVSLSAQSQLVDFGDRTEHLEIDKWVSDSRAHIFKMEDQFIFSSEESCNFFSVDQAPTLHWYFPDH